VDNQASWSRKQKIRSAFNNDTEQVCWGLEAAVIYNKLIENNIKEHQILMLQLLVVSANNYSKTICHTSILIQSMKSNMK
jgi:hypothetical protein